MSVTVIYRFFWIDETLPDLTAQKHDWEVESLIAPCKVVLVSTVLLESFSVADKIFFLPFKSLLVLY